MKIRCDFVTNSSSSSFVVMEIESNTLVEIINKFKDELKAEAICILDEIENGKVCLSAEDYIDPPEKASDIVASIAQLFCYEVYIPGYYENNEEDQEAKEEFEEILEDEDYGVSAMVAKEIIENKKSIETDLKSFYGEFIDYSYGGDSDALYHKENYEEEYLKNILQIIAKENGCSVDEIDDFDFIRYVGRFTGEDKITVKYSKEANKISSVREFKLNDR